MNDEKEPRTGATPDDAELQASAVKVLGAIATAVNDPEIVAHINFGHGESYARGYNEGYDAGFHDGFGDTLPPGMVIAAASDVLTPERKDLIRRAATFGELCKNIDSLPSDAAHEAEREDLYAACREALSELTDADLATLREMAS